MKRIVKLLDNYMENSSMSKVLIVCHRYAPYAGGTEIYCRNIAEELRERGHDVTVLAQTHDPAVLKAGHYNGVKVTSDHNVLMHIKYDLIVVHGGDVSSQNVVHNYAAHIISPVLYLIIKPSESQACINGLLNHKYIGYSTLEDLELIEKYGVKDKARRVRHGIRLSESLGAKKTKEECSRVNEFSKIETAQITRFVSVGGFWPHKGMQELADIFTKTFTDNRCDVRLDLYGYDCQHLAPSWSSNIRVHFGKSRQEVMDAIANCELYIMNSTEEGFGLVLLEAMVNRVPWAARPIAGARLMKDYGLTYDGPKQLAMIMKMASENLGQDRINKAYDYAMKNHLIRNTVDDIEDVLNV